MLRVEDIELAYGAIPVVQGVSFEVREGEVVAIVGANGAGKSTILKAIAGSIHPRKGQISFDGKDTSFLSSPEIVKAGITYVPENRRLFTPLTVEENLEIGAYTVRDPQQIQENRGYVIQSGRVVLEGTGKELLESDMVKKAFLGL